LFYFSCFTFSTAFDVKRILENLPNIGEVTVTKSTSVNDITWSITFVETFDVPLLEIHFSDVKCYGNSIQPSITYLQNADFPGSESYSWNVIASNSTDHSGNYYFR
jgi:hypothetical protein